MIGFGTILSEGPISGTPRHPSIKPIPSGMNFCAQPWIYPPVNETHPAREPNTEAGPSPIKIVQNASTLLNRC